MFASLGATRFSEIQSVGALAWAVAASDEPFQRASAAGRELSGERPSGHRNAKADASVVLLVDEVPVLRDGLTDLLRELCDDLAIIGLDSGSLQSAARESEPDLIIINARQEKLDGDWLRGLIRDLPTLCRGVPILLVSELDLEGEGVRALDRGFAGFIPSTQSGAQLIAAIRVLLAGGRFLLSLNRTFLAESGPELNRSSADSAGGRA
jgi:DNA-binding NarL/FixJ family response regulator